ncbi:hypothetical protein [Stakelama marina]|uniref:Flagellar FliJ protein n=1 Tax=Stakelama marina TaxID=2826939 RepID=A0A8T4I9V1_9SPHN|nr:hypothetical protein [Stakelama marina]MBR0550912.1 hypothetical protein [Stakelama marina]
MKTPFDAILRTRRRELDQVRIAINAEASRLVEIDDAHAVLREEVARECHTASADWAMSTHAYLRRKLAERATLHARRIAAAENVEMLRGRAAETYGSMRAIENAADRFRFDVERRRQRAEQQAADEAGTARFVRDANAARRPQAGER